MAVGNLKIELEKKLEEIAVILCDSIDEFENPGVLAGVSGLALFMYYYSRYTNEQKYKEIGMQALEKAVDMLNNGYNLPNFCNGISGFTWTCKHLEKNGFVDTKTISFVEDLEPYLLSCFEREFKNKNYDFLHGGLGIGFYFVENNESLSEKFVENLLNYLVNTAIPTIDGGLKWKSINSDDESPLYETGIAHGVAGIIAYIAILNKQYPAFFSKKKEIVAGSINYILQQQFSETGILYYLFNKPKNETVTKHISLGWCNADLGIFYALLMASHKFSNKNWKKIALEMLEHCCNHKNIDETSINDACLCHGTSGIAHIFNRLFYETKKPVFQETSVFWLMQTLNFAKFCDGLAGYKMWNSIEFGGWKNNFTLLTGIIGIGLSIISYLDPSLMNWDRCILLS